MGLGDVPHDRQSEARAAVVARPRVVSPIEALENLHGPGFDRVTKSVTSGELVVTGETDVEEQADGLGGSFTYCTLGDPIEMDSLLTGESLPSFEALASVRWSSNLSENLHKVSKTLRDFQLREIQSTLVEPLLQIGKGIRGLASFSLLLDYLKDQIFDSSTLEEGRAQFFRGSPLAAQVIFEHQKRCVNKSLQEVFELEWSLALSFCREPDFLEGVRSLLIDKDKSPGWRFAWSSEIPPQEWQKLLAPQEPHLLRPELLRRQPRASVKS